MATVIRFSRHGTKKKPYYRIVVQDKTSPRDGKFIEHIGAFDPVRGEKTVVIERDRLEYWLSTGAKMSDSVKNCLKVVRRQWAQGAAGGGETKPEPAPATKKTSKRETTREA